MSGEANSRPACGFCGVRPSTHRVSARTRHGWRWMARCEVCADRADDIEAMRHVATPSRQDATS